MEEKCNFPAEKDIINRHVEYFLNKVSRLREEGPYSKARTTIPDFPLLRPGDENFYKLKYFEEAVGSYIREDLVNPIFQDLFELYKIDALWPESDGTIKVHFNNESIENETPFEFIIESHYERVGFRYTILSDDEKELQKLLNDYSLKRIEIIDWANTDKFDSNLNSWGLRARFPQKTKGTSLRKFFNEYFSDDFYFVFVNKIREGVSEAKNILGLETIPKLTPQFLSVFKQDKLKDLEDLSFEKLSFNGLQSEFKCTFNDFNESDFEIVKKRFKNREYYQALLGTEEFAKSFITSEYLFKYFEGCQSFDYTAIVSGYVKCIEQLLMRIIEINLAERPGTDKWIKKKNNRVDVSDNSLIRNNPALSYTVKQVAFIPKLKDAFDVTLGPLIWFLNDYPDCWIVSSETVKKAHKILINYKDEDRNDHFHKHNIGDFEIARTIRDNTIFVLVLLLGGCKFSESDTAEDDHQLLGIPRFTFDKLYLELKRVPQGEYRYEIRFRNGDVIKAIRIRKQERPQYDKNGLVQSDIKFIKVNSFSIGSNRDLELFYKSAAEDADLIISRTNIPEKVVLIVISEGEVKKRIQIK